MAFKEADYTHVGFADESSWNKNQYRSISLITCARADAHDCHCVLKENLVESGLRELQWKRLSGARERFGAMRFVDIAIDWSCKGRLRIDVLVWSVKDSRHDVVGRDDAANLEKMYYKLFKNALDMRWKEGCTWALFPDKRDDLSWEKSSRFLGSHRRRLLPALLSEEAFVAQLKKKFEVRKIEPMSYEMTPLIQMADLFAGVGAYSFEKYLKYRSWCEAEDGQGRLWEERVSFSRSENERFRTIRYFLQESVRRGMTVRMNAEKQGLWTPSPAEPVNFWLYEPQHERDKAPTRVVK